MRVLFATPELAPWVKSGGLGDVSAALPAALQAAGADVRLLVPGYRLLMDAVRVTRVAALLAGASSPLDWRPDVLHCHDWPAALAPAYLHHGREPHAPSVMTVHNIAFQGSFDPAVLPALGLPAAAYTMEGVEFYGRLSFLKAGLFYADRITTVSET